MELQDLGVLARPDLEFTDRQPRRYMRRVMRVGFGHRFIVGNVCKLQDGTDESGARVVFRDAESEGLMAALRLLDDEDDRHENEPQPLSPADDVRSSLSSCRDQTAQRIMRRSHRTASVN